MGKLGKGLALSAIASTVVMAGGYKIPEVSLNSMALGAAYVAHTTGADTAYYNPANMSFMEDKNYIEGGLTIVHLPSNVYSSVGVFSGESESENLLVPNLHYIAPAIGDFRWGVSLVVPAGLTKRWETPFQKATAEEFTLTVVELNPSMSYKIADNLSIGAGLRLIYSEGIVKSDATAFGGPKVDMEADTIEFGYNLAVAYKPTNDINIAVTYRSNIDLNEEGSALITMGPVTLFDGDASVSVPLPAALNLAVSKTWNDKFTLEFNYERTYWSKYETLEFIGTPLPIKAKNWKDTNTFRVGVTMEMDNEITVMMGFALDDSPAPVETIGFELPDSDAKVFSTGFRYQQTENLSWGAAFLYSRKDSITVAPGVNTDINPTPFPATFTDGSGFLTTVGMAYEF